MTNKEKKSIPVYIIQNCLIKNHKISIILTSFITRTQKTIIEDIIEKNKFMIDGFTDSHVFNFLVDNNITTQKNQLYFIKQKDTNFYKIGISSDIEKRFKAIQNGNPSELSIYYNEVFYLCDIIEKCLHKFFESQHIRGEWFEIPDDEINDLIKKINKIPFKYEQNKT